MKRFLAAWIAALSCSGYASAGQQSTADVTPARSGFYFDVHGTWAQLGGDFDGNTLLVGSSDSIAVPDADSGLGFGIAAGHRWDRYALELAFTLTTHEGSIPGAPGGDVDYGVLELNGRYFFRTEERLQPFVLGGIGIAVATLEDASTDGVRVGDADLTGLELGLGGGLEYFLGEHWSLGLRALYRFTSFDEAEGVASDSGSIDDSVDGSGMALVFGTAFTL